MRGSQKHLIAAVCTALAALSLTAAPAAARERSVRGEITTDRGRHVDVARDIASQPGGRDARTSLGFQDGTSITQTNSRARGDHSLSANRQTEFRMEGRALSRASAWAMAREPGRSPAPSPTATAKREHSQALTKSNARPDFLYFQTSPSSATLPCAEAA